MKYLLIQAGCAECHHGQGPLIISSGPFDTVEEAKAATYWSNIKEITWEDHPQGGWKYTDGQGEDWVLPVPDNFPTVPEYKEE